MSLKSHARTISRIQNPKYKIQNRRWFALMRCCSMAGSSLRQSRVSASPKPSVAGFTKGANVTNRKSSAMKRPKPQSPSARLTTRRCGTLAACVSAAAARALTTSPCRRAHKLKAIASRRSASCRAAPKKVRALSWRIENSPYSPIVRFRSRYTARRHGTISTAMWWLWTKPKRIATRR